MAERADNTLDLERDDEQNRDPDRADVTPRERPAYAREDAEPRRRGTERADDGAEHGEEQKRTRGPLIALAIAIIIGAIGAATYWYLTKDQVSTDDAYTDGRAVMVSPHVAGYVTVLAVNDNRFVHKGDLLVQIEPKDYEAARDQAEGQWKALEAQLENGRVALDKARIVYPAQLSQAEGQLRQARGQLYQAQREFSRQMAMNDLATTQANRDNANSSYQSASGQTQQAQAQVHQSELVQQNIAQAEAQVRQLEGQVEQARGSLEQAQINLGYTRVVAPQDGWVTKRNVEVGDYLQSGQQIMALVVPELWVTANFKETALARMRPGQRVKIHVDAYPRLKLIGHVDSVQLGSGVAVHGIPSGECNRQFRQDCPACAGEDRDRQWSRSANAAAARRLRRADGAVEMSDPGTDDEAAQDRGAWRPSGNKWLIAVVVTLAAFMEILDTTIVNVSLRHIAGSMSVSYDDATWSLTSYLVANGFVLTISGWLARVLARKRYFLICVAMFSVASLLCGLSRSLPELIVLRTAQGFFGGDCSRPSKRSSSTPSARRSARARSDLPPSLRSWHQPSDRRSAAGSPTITVGPGSSSSMCRLGY